MNYNTIGFELRKIAKQACRLSKLEEEFNDSWRDYFHHEVEPFDFEDKKFWEICDEYIEALKLYNICSAETFWKRRIDAVYSLIHQIVVAKVLITKDADRLIDLIRFTKTWDDLNKLYSNILFNVLEGMGSDSFNDYIESLLFTGKTGYNFIADGEAYSMSHGQFKKEMQSIAGDELSQLLGAELHQVGTFIDRCRHSFKCLCHSLGEHCEKFN